MNPPVPFETGNQKKQTTINMPAQQQGYLPNSEEVASEVLDGEAVIINLSNGMYYSIDGVGGRIWELVEIGQSQTDMVRDITARYDVDEDTANADITRFIEELLAENLVVPADGPAGDPPDMPADIRQPYSPPELNVFRDMGDLLALDPPMPGLKDLPWKDANEEPSS